MLGYARKILNLLVSVLGDTLFRLLVPLCELMLTSNGITYKPSLHNVKTAFCFYNYVGFKSKKSL